MRRSCRSIAAMGAALSWLLATPLAAQEPGGGPGSLHAESARGGWWYGFAVGLGFSRVGCDICRGDLAGGPAATLKGGLRAAPGLLVGLEANGWAHDEGSVSRLHGTFNALALWYPNRWSGLHVKGGLGLTLYRAADEEDAFTGTSFGPQVGVGYDVPIGSRMSLTPQIDLTTAGLGDLRLEGEPVTDSAVFQLLRIGIGLTWH